MGERRGAGERAARVKHRVFLLSPADCSGKRATYLQNEAAEFELAARLHRPEGAPLGEVFAFVSSLYFRGKLAYARAFARPPLFGGTSTLPRNYAGGGIYVITPCDGLLSPDAIVRADDLRRYAGVPVNADEPRYAAPFQRDVEALQAAWSDTDTEVVLLGSVASPKYKAAPHRSPRRTPGLPRRLRRPRRHEPRRPAAAPRRRGQGAALRAGAGHKAPWFAAGKAAAAPQARLMRIATWNVNSLKARFEKLRWWLDRARPDVLLMQETKLADADVPTDAVPRRSATRWRITARGAGTASPSRAASASPMSSPTSACRCSRRAPRTPATTSRWPRRG